VGVAAGLVGLLLLSAGAAADTSKGGASSLKVNVGGPKFSGEVTSNPSGISCPEKCIELVEPGTQYTLTATPESGYAFVGFGGACASTETTCTFTVVEGSNLVTADFAAAPSGDDAACDKAKEKLAKAKAKLAELRAAEAAAPKIKKAKEKVKKAKDKVKDACDS
jgi:hypothetical protein